MIYGLYLSAAGALMESARHSVISNNLANVNTTGFREDLAVVRARDAEALEDRSAAPYATPMDLVGGGAILSETYTKAAQGAIHSTGNPFDFAIEGEGFFAVTNGDGVSYTRAGEFVRDTSGRLATADGKHFLADESGKPITIPLEGEVSVGRDGTISVNGAPAAKIDLFRFDNPRALVKTGANLYRSVGGEGTTQGAGRVVQGSLEASTVSPAAELARMIMASRGYELNMQLIRMQDQTLVDLVALGRLSM